MEFSSQFFDGGRKEKAVNFCRRITSEKSWLSCALGTHLYIVYTFWQRDCGWTTHTGRRLRPHWGPSASALRSDFSEFPECVRTQIQCGWTTRTGLPKGSFLNCKFQNQSINDLIFAQIVLHTYGPHPIEYIDCLIS